MAGYRIIVGGVVAVVAGAVLAGPADANAIGERLVLDGCEVGGGGNDIHSVQSHYEPERDRIVVTLRLCGPARPKATYRVYLDHAAPFVGRGRRSGHLRHDRGQRGRARAGRPPGRGHQPGAGETVRFVVPLAKLHVGKPKDVPLIPLWATSTLGKVEDRAPNRETGDGCVHPRATTETLVQARVAVTGIAFIPLIRRAAPSTSSPPGAIVWPTFCRQDANSAGLTNSDRDPRLAVQRGQHPSSYVERLLRADPDADGTPVVRAPPTSPTATRTGTVPAGADRQGRPRQSAVGYRRSIWTGALPDGNNGGGELLRLPRLDLELGQRYRRWWEYRSIPTRASRSEPRTAATRCID